MISLEIIYTYYFQGANPLASYDRGSRFVASSPTLMKYRGLAADYDGTLAQDGKVDDATIDALRRARAAGLRLLIVTGRELSDLLTAFPSADRFDLIVAENGAVLYDPSTRAVELLAEPAPPALVQRLKDANVPLFVGGSIVATATPYEHEVMTAIHELGLKWHLVLNSGAVMALPADVTKATGLAAALRRLDLPSREVVGVGDAENDQDLLRYCGFSVAVSNALDGLKGLADFTTAGARGAGVCELIDRLLRGEFDDIEPAARPGR